MRILGRVSGLEEGLRLEALERERITDTPRDVVFDGLIDQACTALAAPMGAISFLEKERVWVKAGRGINLSETPRQGSFCSETLLSDAVTVVEDASTDPRFATNPYVTGADVRFYAGAPLVSRAGFRLGALSVMDKLPRQLDAQHRKQLKEVSAMVVHALEQRRHRGMDMLTGLFTHGFLHETGGRELIRARREAKPLAAAFIAPHLRRSRGGHGASGIVMNALGLAARRTLREDDLLGCYTGEELAVLLPATTLSEAVRVLRRLRGEFAARDELSGITVSLSAAVSAPEDLTIDDLLRRASKALQRARLDRRDRVALAA